MLQKTEFYFSKIFLILIGLILFSSCKQEPKIDPTAFFMPGEFEPHEAVWFGTWYMGDWASDYKRVTSEVMKAIQSNVEIKMAVPADSLLLIVKHDLDSLGVDTAKIQFFIMPGDDFWIRDYGAAFVVNRQGELGAVDFDWVAYGKLNSQGREDSTGADSLKLLRKKQSYATSKVDSLMAVATGAKWIKGDLFIEGGSIEINGKGVLIQCEAVTLQRNPDRTKEDLEDVYKKSLGIKKVIWLPKGLAEDENGFNLQLGKYVGYGTGGHTDEFVRFADSRTILLAWVDESEVDAHPLNRINYERMSENYEILKKATDQDGKPFKIIKIPLPFIQERSVIVSDFIYDDYHISSKAFASDDREKLNEGDTLVGVAAASYLNFLVTNGVVVTATYAKDEVSINREKEVEHLFQKAFPGRKIVFINALQLNRHGGGIHCITQQEPKRKLK